MNTIFFVKNVIFSYPENDSNVSRISFLERNEKFIYKIGLLVLLSICTIYDMKTFKIPNVIFLISVIVFFFFNLIYTSQANNSPSGLPFIYQFCVSILFFYALSLFFCISSGDIKMFSIIIGFIGFKDGISIIFYSLLFACMYFLVSKTKKIPLAPFLLLGSFFYFFITGV